ncbi:MAG: flippase-like domain-containing protein [Gaiella sp.]|nr:flippase-like domain-containing protein [Gaiella sp.]
MRLAKLLAGGALFAAVLVVTVREWHDVSDTVAEIGPAPIGFALTMSLLGLGLSALTWRIALAELGAGVSVPAGMKIYLVGQLGKYIPGSVWAIVIQMELARAAAVRRAQSVGAVIVAVAINILTGSALGLVVQPFIGGGSDVRYVAAGIGIVCCAVVLAPPVLGRLADLGLRFLRQPTLERRPRWPNILAASGFSIASWLSYGTALGILAIGAGADPSKTLRLALPAVALAMTIGFLVVVAPSGLGVREAVLVAALSPVLEPASALAVALVLRVVFTLADLLAATATLPIRITSVRQPAPALPVHREEPSPGGS